MKNKKKYICDVCGSESFWTKNHSRWGSILTDEYGHSVVTCSDDCRKKLTNPAKKFREKYGRAPRAIITDEI